jgi:hypothetical protein
MLSIFICTLDEVCHAQVMGIMLVPCCLWMCTLHPLAMVMVLLLLPPLLYFLARYQVLGSWGQILSP